MPVTPKCKASSPVTSTTAFRWREDTAAGMGKGICGVYSFLWKLSTQFHFSPTSMLIQQVLKSPSFPSLLGVVMRTLGQFLSARFSLQVSLGPTSGIPVISFYRISLITLPFCHLFFHSLCSCAFIQIILFLYCDFNEKKIGFLIFS